MTIKRLTIFFILPVFLLAAAWPSFSQDQHPIPDQVYQELEYLSSLFESDEEIDPEQITGLVDFVDTTPEDTSQKLKKRNGMEGVLHIFQIDSSFGDLLDYVYNPDLPAYITRPSSLQKQQWITPEIDKELRRLIDAAEETGTPIFLRGQENETITPDTNTGSYYSYSQDRQVALLPGSPNPIMVSVTLQDQISDIGRRGCIVGEDGNWDYLYSEKTGLNKIGLGWVDSYMYEAYSVIIYLPDPITKSVKVGIFKWLNAGWQKINMVRAYHILGGIKRFAADLKSVLESPDLPEVTEIVDKYLELQQKEEEELRHLVAPYLKLIGNAEDAGTCPSSFISSVASGEYLAQMSSEEIIRILLLEYIKTHIGDRSPETADTGNPYGWSRQQS
ncbi:MAG: hypothetical protein ACR2PB_02590 [Desulfocapsaceae bacterium]